jgi:predicted transcriptional regulator
MNTEVAMQMTTIRCDENIMRQLDVIAESQNRSRSWVINQALLEYVDREARRAQYKTDVLASWKHYQDTGLHVTGEELTAWLETWGTDQPSEIPQCHR